MAVRNLNNFVLESQIFAMLGTGHLLWEGGLRNFPKILVPYFDPPSRQKLGFGKDRYFGQYFEILYTIFSPQNPPKHPPRANEPKNCACGARSVQNMEKSGKKVPKKSPLRPKSSDQGRISMVGSEIICFEILLPSRGDKKLLPAGISPSFRRYEST